MGLVVLNVEVEKAQHVVIVERANGVGNLFLSALRLLRVVVPCDQRHGHGFGVMSWRFICLSPH